MPQVVVVAEHDPEVFGRVQPRSNEDLLNVGKAALEVLKLRKRGLLLQRHDETGLLAGLLEYLCRDRSHLGIFGRPRDKEQTKLALLACGCQA